MNQDSTTKEATQKFAKSTTATNKKYKGFTDEERAAKSERAKELKAEARAKQDRAAEKARISALVKKAVR